MPRIFITGSTDGLGRAAAGVLISEGHDVVLHARTRERAAALSDLAADAAGVVIGDLSSAAETRDLAGQVNEIGRTCLLYEPRLPARKVKGPHRIRVIHPPMVRAPPFESARGHPYGAVCVRSSRRLRAHSSASVSRLR